MAASHSSLVSCALGQHRTDPDTFAQRVGDALRDTGFFALTDHGIDAEIVRSAYARAEDFFRLDENQKRAYEDEALLGQRGFVRFGKERAKDGAHSDLKEFFHVGPELPPHDPLLDVYGKNLWPNEVVGFRERVGSLYAALERVAADVLDACARYAGLPETTFSEKIVRGDSVLRIIHYPPLVGDVPPGAMRAAAHEDINFITLLVGATEPGLELKDRGGVWGDVIAPEGSIIIDSGDMLQNLTNGLFRSTTHRVKNPDDVSRARYSMPFFVHPRADVDLTPMPACVAQTGGAAGYPSISARALLEERLSAIGLAPTRRHAH